MKKTASIFLFLVFVSGVYAQSEGQKKVDSLLAVIKHAKHDSIVIKCLQTWDYMLPLEEVDSSLHINARIDEVCDQNLKKKLSKKEWKYFKSAKAESYNSLGILMAGQSDYKACFGYFNKCLKLREEIGDRIGVGGVLSNIGNIYYRQGNYKKAIDYLTKSLKISEEAGDTLETLYPLNNIAQIHNDLGDYQKAIKYYKKCLNISQDAKFSVGVAASLINLGVCYQYLKDHTKALGYFDEGYQVAKEIDNPIYMSNALSNSGSSYRDMKDYEKALDYYRQALELREKLGDKDGISNSYSNLGDVYMAQGQIEKAIDMLSKSLVLAREVNSLNSIKESSDNLWKCYKAKSQYKNALETFEIYVAAKDSLESEENHKAVIRQEFKYEYEKQAAKDSVKTAEEKKVKDAQIAQQDAEIHAKQNQQYMLFGGLALVLVFAGFMYNRFKITQKQKGIIEEQKHTVEEKNKEITDSITYAKRIQSAILPPAKIVKEYLPHSFILYKPKDIVAGDFYWMEPVASTNSTTLLFAACDCTGHGVPGAMVSVVCNNGLNRAVREFGLTDPGKILDKTRELVIQEFEKSEEEVKDGMDISICKLEIIPFGHEKLGNLKLAETINKPKSQISNLKLSWAGANNPLWIIRNGDLIEYKANKQPIGKYSNPTPFTTHEIEIKKGDTIYIFTDGFADQFGGEKGKKFKSSKFKELLLSIQDKNMDEQKEIINSTFESWTGNLEQNDDVCIIGVRI